MTCGHACHLLDQCFAAAREAGAAHLLYYARHACPCCKPGAGCHMTNGHTSVLLDQCFATARGAWTAVFLQRMRVVCVLVADHAGAAT
jgi:hypothetical protein